MTDIVEQVELVSRAASSQTDRALFIADPIEYADSLGVELDKGFAAHMRDRLLEIEGQMSSQGLRNELLEKLEIKPREPGWVDPRPDDFQSKLDAHAPVAAATGVLVAAAVVSAVASVVSAVSTTYMATNWLTGTRGIDVEIGPRLKGVREIVGRNEFLRPDMRVITRTLKGFS